MSQPMPKAEKKAARNEARDTIVVIIEALLIAVLFRTFVYQPFSIPTAFFQQKTPSVVSIMAGTSFSTA